MLLSVRRLMPSLICCTAAVSESYILRPVGVIFTFFRALHRLRVLTGWFVFLVTFHFDDMDVCPWIKWLYFNWRAVAAARSSASLRVSAAPSDTDERFPSVLMWSCSARRIILKPGTREGTWQWCSSFRSSLRQSASGSLRIIYSIFTSLGSKWARRWGTSSKLISLNAFHRSGRLEKWWLPLPVSLFSFHPSMQHLIVSSLWVWGWWLPGALPLLRTVVFLTAAFGVCVRWDAELHVQANLPLPLELKA